MKDTIQHGKEYIYATVLADEGLTEFPDNSWERYEDMEGSVWMYGVETDSSTVKKRLEIYRAERTFVEYTKNKDRINGKWKVPMLIGLSGYDSMEGHFEPEAYTIIEGLEGHFDEPGPLGALGEKEEK